jgi:hypothetical protein
MSAAQKNRSHIGSTTAKERAKEFPADFYDDNVVSDKRHSLSDKSTAMLVGLYYNTCNGPNAEFRS